MLLPEDLPLRKIRSYAQIEKGPLAIVFACQKFHHCTFVTGFERTHLPRTQQEDTLFTITR